jgi:fructose-bisphosphate aldolase class I
VDLEGSLLKPSMTTAGASHPGPQSPEEVAEFTRRTMARGVPAAVAGILFLSGGLGEEEASLYLNAINACEGPRPWHLGFSYGRALQHSCLLQWRGSDVDAGQRALLARAQANSEACRGTYVAGSQPSDGKHLFVADYAY